MCANFECQRFLYAIKFNKINLTDSGDTRESSSYITQDQSLLPL